MLEKNEPSAGQPDKDRPESGAEEPQEESSAREEHKNNVVGALLTANYTSVVFGWLAMMGAALVLSSIAGGFIAAGFEQDGSDTNAARSWERVSFLTTVFLSFLVGGYVTGRMAGRSGVRHGLMVPLLALIATLILVLFGLVVGVSLVENLGGVTLPELSSETSQSVNSILSASGILALFLIPFVGGAFGGAWGARTEKRIVREHRGGDPEGSPGSE